MGINKAYSVGGAVYSPTESIEKGVKILCQIIEKTQSNQLGEMAALQAYSYGEAYLDDLIRIRGRYSFDHSRLYAQEKSQGETVSYNSTVAFGSWLQLALHLWQYVLSATCHV